MGIPNTIVKMIDKHGKMSDFQISKIANAITLAILDVENTSRWSAERRAQKYAEAIQNSIFNEFYNPVWLLNDFIIFHNFNRRIPDSFCKNICC